MQRHRWSVWVGRVIRVIILGLIVWGLARQ